MGTFLQQYGVEEEHRNRTIRRIILGLAGALVVGIVAYVALKDYGEKQKANQFINLVNGGKFEDAYREWGCTSTHPCPNYDFKRFLQDWGPGKKAVSPWKVVSTDSCRQFVTVNVQATGADLQSLSVQRSDKSLGFAPAPECQEAKWRWKQFFDRIFSGGTKS